MSSNNLKILCQDCADQLIEWFNNPDSTLLVSTYKDYEHLHSEKA